MRKKLIKRQTEGVLSRKRPRPIARDGVNLPVVRDEAKRLRFIPGGACIRAESPVNKRESRGESRIFKIEVELVEMLRLRERLIDDRCG